MWCMVLVLALVATVDPVRIGVTVALSSRPRSLGPLVAFWLGGLAVSTVVTATVLFGMRDVTLAAVHRVQLAAASPNAGHIQVAMGVLALAVAAVTMGLSPHRQVREGLASTDLTEPRALSRLVTRGEEALRSRPLGMAFALGVGMLVDFRLLAALTAIAASGAAPGVQIGASGMYILIALSFVEIPLVSQLAAPATTDRIMGSVHRWTKDRRQQVAAVVIGVVGVLLMTRGIGHA
ncbi:GAP family protein [Mycobacterium asiaticum]|nr:GAP family protein [Mycobacterium asiaticum]